MSWFDALVTAAAVFGGAVASVTGFGIGSLLTPTLALQVDTRLAVAAVSVPHLIGTSVRFWLLRAAADRRVLWSFGLTSFAGGLTGALLQAWASNQWLMAVFGLMLLVAATNELIGVERRMQFHGSIGWVAGAVSGLLGGLVGHHGGIRSAALLGTDLSKETFVGTATAIGLFVDAARLPVYLATQSDHMAAIWRWMAVATVGVIAGTVLGHRVLVRIPEVWFRHTVAVILAALGGLMLVRAVQS